MLGLPLTVAIIGGEPHRFRPLINLYREAGRRAGHAPDLLDVAVHAIGYVAETDQQAADDLWPAYVHTFTRIGKERGWGPTTRAAFDAQRGPSGAFVVGSPETAAAKMQHISDSLGGVSQVSLMMSGGPLSHNKMLRAIALLGSEVRPRVQQGAAAAIA
jgi:alkanesulfonate monooxygenase SsuD/methylene tetrahydromethanopterin reductase-like flavin-dependent oxidoreductase (luciferase family)